jgi:hypothetical protein
MDHHKKLQLEGHSQGVRVHYTDRDIEDLRGLYRQAYIHLDLSEAAVKEKAMIDMETQIKELKRENEQLREKMTDIQRTVREEVGREIAKVARELRKEKARE